MSELEENKIVPAGQDKPAHMLEFKTDIIVYGMLAAHWSNAGPVYGACKRGWGTEYRSGGIQVGNDTYTAGHVVSDKNPMALAAYGPGRLGMLFTRHIDIRNGGKRQESYWMPMETFAKATLKVEGIRV